MPERNKILAGSQAACLRGSAWSGPRAGDPQQEEHELTRAHIRREWWRPYRFHRICFSQLQGHSLPIIHGTLALSGSEQTECVTWRYEHPPPHLINFCTSPISPSAQLGKTWSLFFNMNKINDRGSCCEHWALTECTYNYCVSFRHTDERDLCSGVAAEGGEHVTWIEHNVFYLREWAQIYGVTQRHRTDGRPSPRGIRV